MSQTPQKPLEPTPIMAQISMLNLRISDMMTQLNSTLKMLIEENQTLKQAAEQKEKTGKP
ncbi:MAG: hypothetical protein NWE93_05910 [Candidatus Bathyarchaeota archaeon]|nr:hypothetical protein [Candidatus Bathyarchaeota archaeon]